MSVKQPHVCTCALCSRGCQPKNMPIYVNCEHCPRRCAIEHALKRHTHWRHVGQLWWCRKGSACVAAFKLAQHPNGDGPPSHRAPYTLGDVFPEEAPAEPAPAEATRTAPAESIAAHCDRLAEAIAAHCGRLAEAIAAGEQVPPPHQTHTRARATPTARVPTHAHTQLPAPVLVDLGVDEALANADQGPWATPPVTAESWV